MMPRKFVEKYGEGLSKAIYLKTPNGAKWKLNLVKSDGKIWFEKGWKEFAKHHSLAHGHLLLFKYKRNSHFLVHIFEKSAFEINYPFQRVAAKTNRVSNGQGNKPPNGESRRASQKRKDNSFELHQPCDIGSSSCFRVEKLQKVASLHHTDRESKGKEVITGKRVTALERAQSFKTSNPSFVVVMRASYVKHHFLLNIPRSFGNRHFDLDKKRGDIYFQVLNKGVWPAKYSIKKTRNGLHFELMTTGWKAFAKDNKLKVDDVCKFELISCTILTFIVHIFRETDNDNTNCSTFQSRIN
ncbi:putative transcription factor B3-Domain family [Medicago truncatula]|uniref:Putative transcription factor B3-Domain family n=1 Tax=Medicago truncatula TaxID=3880 RepID=G7KVV7_MEDTR|nr:transcriptional factor B3 family protein [Medicago truncatula]RHN45639.1 putative transcription factor B3-Domain family [Medicago truncatula]